VSDLCYLVHLLLAHVSLKINICSIIIFPFVLYGHETWRLNLSEEPESRLRVSEKNVLRVI
jgi:hypothetical protein